MCVYIYLTNLRSKQRQVKLEVMEAEQLQIISCLFPAAVHIPSSHSCFLGAEVERCTVHEHCTLNM